MFISRRAALVTQAAPDYSTGDVCGGVSQFTMRTPGGGGRLTRLVLKCLQAVAIDSQYLLFDSSPAESTVAENGTLSIHANDKTRLIGRVAIATADWVNLGAIAADDLYYVEKALDLPFFFAGGTGKTIYGIFVPTGTLNLASTADIEAILGAEVD